MFTQFFNTIFIFTSFFGGAQIHDSIPDSSKQEHHQSSSFNKPDSLQLSITKGVKKETIRVAIENPEKKRLVCIFHRQGGNVLDKLVLNADGPSTIIRTYNLGDLEDGQYLFEVFDGRKKLVRKIEYAHFTPEPVVVFSFD